MYTSARAYGEGVMRFGTGARVRFWRIYGSGVIFTFLLKDKPMGSAGAEFLRSTRTSSG